MGFAMLLLTSLLAASAVGSITQKQADSFKRHLDCNGFQTTFTLTKAMLYTQASPPPDSNYFFIGGVTSDTYMAGYRRENLPGNLATNSCKGKFKLRKKGTGSGPQWADRFTLDWFDANNLENCGIQVTETNDGSTKRIFAAIPSVHEPSATSEARRTDVGRGATQTDLETRPKCEPNLTTRHALAILH